MVHVVHKDIKKGGAASLQPPVPNRNLKKDKFCTRADNYFVMKHVVNKDIKKGGLPACSPLPRIEIKKKFVPALIPKVKLRLCFSLNQALKSAND